MLGADRLRVLLVDAEGALGAALCQALRRLGAELLAFGGDLPEQPGLRRVAGSRARPDELDGIGPGEFDAAVDFGARGLQAPAALAAALRGRVGLLVQLGSWRVYAGAEDAPDCRARGAGPTPPGPVLPVPCPESAPARDGVALDAEDGLWNSRAGGDYPATVLRLAPLYGPGVRLAREWHVVGRLRAGRARMALPDGGDQLLHRLYLDNAVHAVVRALDHPREADGHTFNVGDSRVPPLAELCAAAAAVAERPLALEPLPRAVFDTHNPFAVPRPVLLDLHRLRHRLGYAEPVAPEEGLRRTVRWLLDLPEDDVLPVLAPYWRRFGCGHDLAAEEAALARWALWRAEGR